MNQFIIDPFFVKLAEIIKLIKIKNVKGIRIIKDAFKNLYELFRGSSKAYFMIRKTEKPKITNPREEKWFT